MNNKFGGYHFADHFNRVQTSMKKIGLLLLVAMLLLTSCSVEKVRMNFFEEDDTIIADNTLGQILEAINARDHLKLKTLFSKSVQDEANDLEENALNFIEFIQGNIVSFSKASEAGVGADYKTENGKKQKEIQSAFYIETSEHQYYIAIGECIRDDSNNRDVGVTSIYIIESKKWNEDYIYRGDGEWLHGINILE